MPGDKDEISTAHNPHSKLISLVGQRSDLTPGGLQKAVNVLNQNASFFLKRISSQSNALALMRFQKKWAL
jgi:hypothetical protein